MDKTQKMLQAIINGQNALRDELTRKIEEKIDRSSHELKVSITKELRSEMAAMEERLSTRLDKIGMSLAYLEDDTPTRKEHETLKRRVRKLEKKISPAN